jgi:hypothetical protein
MNAMTFMGDAQRSLSFLTQQLTYIEPQVYRIQYPDLPWAELVPVDTSAPEWIKSVTYFSTDAVGQAQWFAGQAHDVPLAEVLRDKGETQVRMAAIGYRYTTEELGTAQLMGMNLSTDKAAAARRAHFDFVNRVTFFGDTTVGQTGVVNSAAVTVTTAPADGTASATAATAKTPAQIVRDLNGQLTGIYTGTNTVEMADTVLMPIALLMYLAATPYASGSNETILSFFQRTNAYTATTGRQLTIRGILGLETAGAGGVSRVVFYRRNPEVLKLHMPMPFRFLPVWQTGPMVFEVPGIFRLGGVDFRRPSAARYLDGL